MAHQTGTTASESAVRVNRDMPREAIEKRAFQRYCDRGCAPGGELEDWIAAERELLAEHTGGETPSSPESISAPSSDRPPAD